MKETIELIIGLIALGGFILVVLICAYVREKSTKIQLALTGELIPKEVIVKINYWKGNIPIFRLPDGTKIEVNVFMGGRIFYYIDEDGKTKFALCKKLEICQIPELKEGKLLIAQGYNGVYYIRKVKRVEREKDIICGLLGKEDVEEYLYGTYRNNGEVLNNVYIVLYVTKN